MARMARARARVSSMSWRFYNSLKHTSYAVFIIFSDSQEEAANKAELKTVTGAGIMSSLSAM
jgi:hypothetical protein